MLKENNFGYFLIKFKEKILMKFVSNHFNNIVMKVL
jgi:hypothetical protein